MEKMKRVKALLAAAFAAAGLVAFAEPEVEIIKAWQANPGSGVVDFTYEVRDLDGASCDVIVRVEAKGCDKTYTFTNENVSAGLTMTNVDYKTKLGKVSPNVSIYASLAIRPATVPTDAEGFDYTTDGVTFLPGDYCVVDLATGAETMMSNVTDPTIFNTEENKTTKMVFRYVPAGKFKAHFGRSGSSDLITADAELSAYWLAIYPMTKAQYATVMGETFTEKIPLVGSDYTWNTVRGGSWNGTSGTPDTDTVIGKLNARCAGKYDLPSSLQWERAARAGTRTDYFFGKNQTADPMVTDDAIKPFAWYKDNSDGGYHDVGTRSANAWGIEPYGNVYSACLDWIESSLSSDQITKDYAGPATGEKRVARGGDVWGDINSVSSVHRYSEMPDVNHGSIGFRLVRMEK